MAVLPSKDAEAIYAGYYEHSKKKEAEAAEIKQSLSRLYADRDHPVDYRPEVKHVALPVTDVQKGPIAMNVGVSGASFFYSTQGRNRVRVKGGRQTRWSKR